MSSTNLHNTKNDITDSALLAPVFLCYCSNYKMNKAAFHAQLNDITVDNAIFKYDTSIEKREIDIRIQYSVFPSGANLHVLQISITPVQHLLTALVMPFTPNQQS